MAANKFASMLHKNCPKIIVILTYAVLEWILILLLLLNSFFSHLIAKFAQSFGLKPSCTWCSRLDHVFDSNKKAKSPHLDHVCEAHGTEISKMSYCSTHNKLASSKNLCIHCFSSNRTANDISSTVAFFTWMSEDSSQGGEEESRCSCCDEIMNAKACPQPLFFKPTWDVLLEYMHKKKAEFEPDLVKKETDQIQENGEEGDGKKAEIVEDSNVEVEEWNSSERADDPFDEDEESVFISDMLLQNAELMDSDRFICIELNIDAEMAATHSSEEEKYSVLENEENLHHNSAENSSETEAFVQNKEEEAVTAHEKAMNALYAELEEERRAAAEAAKQTMAMITKLQEEKAAIQMEALQYQRMMEEQAEYDQEALQLLNDLMTRRDKEKREVEKELQTYRERENSSRTLSRRRSLASSSNNTPSIDLDCYDHDLDDEIEGMGLEGLIVPDISLAEFDEERASILEELKALEGKLLHLHDDGGDDSMAMKLLPLFDEESGLVEGDCDEVERGNQEAAAMKGKILIHEELGHVYERLQALEADKEFLKHCIRSMIKGDQGTALVQEILQNLRDLKSVELSARKLVDTPLSDASMPEEDHQENSPEMRFSSA